LRREGFDGTLTIVGDENAFPYDRPPLSKQVLSGEWEVDQVDLTTAEKRKELDADWRLASRATGLAIAAGARGQHRVSLHDGTTIEADRVLIATGARCRTLPGTEAMTGVYTLRTVDDARAIRAAFDAGPRRVVVVGAGFIGAEVAATARGRNLDVTMIEAAPVPLQRGLGAEMGAVCGEIHREHGVDLRLGVGVNDIISTGSNRDGPVNAVVLSDGDRIDADLVVVGVGVVPNTEWLDNSGLMIDNGVVCDRHCIAAPGIAAAGDVARWPNELFDETMRVEHWDNAVAQGVHAAKRLLHGDGFDEPFAPVPWFWSDQYDRKIQLAGRSGPDDDVEIVTGSIEERRFAAIYGRGGRIVGVLGFNRPRHVMQYRKLIAAETSWSDALAHARDSS